MVDRSGMFLNQISGFSPRNPLPDFPENSVFPGLQNRELMDSYSFAPYSNPTWSLDTNRRAIPNGFSNQNGISVDDLARIPPRRGNNARINVENPYSYDYTIRAQGMQNGSRIYPQNKLSIDDFRGKIVSLAKDQRGSKMLQDLIDSASRESIDGIFMEVIGEVGELMKDSSAKSVVEKLLKLISEEQTTQLVLMITRNQNSLASICVDTYGTRLVQTLLERLTSQQQISIFMAALSPLALELTKETNGSHVIIHCLKNFSDEDNKYLLNQVADHCFSIATDKSGCCVLKYCVEYSSGETRERMVDEIIANALHLAEHPYGNYVVQNLLGLKVPEITHKLLRQLEGSYAALSCNKYASHFVEKCLKEFGDQYATKIITELLNSQNASMLIFDPYGNYVIQSALTVSENLGEVHTALLRLILQNVPLMSSNMYGKKVLERLENKHSPQERRRQNGRRYQHHQDFLQFGSFCNSRWQP